MASVDDLWLIDFGEPYPGEPAKHRPGLILGPPRGFGSRFPFIIVAPLTMTYRGLSLHVEIEPSPDNGLETTSYIQCELIRSVNRNRLVHRLGIIDSGTSTRVADIVKTLLTY